MYIEGLREPRRFFEVARKVTRRKPVFVLKGGRTQSGAARAFSHTASLAGNDLIFDAACRQTGIARLKRYCDLIHVAKAVAFQPIPKGKRVSSLAPSGLWGWSSPMPASPSACRWPNIRKPRGTNSGRSAPPG